MKSFRSMARSLFRLQILRLFTRQHRVKSRRVKKAEKQFSLKSKLDMLERFSKFYFYILKIGLENIHWRAIKENSYWESAEGVEENKSLSCLGTFPQLYIDLFQAFLVDLRNMFMNEKTVIKLYLLLIKNITVFEFQCNTIYVDRFWHWYQKLFILCACVIYTMP